MPGTLRTRLAILGTVLTVGIRAYTESTQGSQSSSDSVLSGRGHILFGLMLFPLMESYPHHAYVIKCMLSQ